MYTYNEHKIINTILSVGTGNGYHVVQSPHLLEKKNEAQR